MKIAVCDDDRTTREQIASLIREQEPDAEVVTFEAGEEMIKSQENFTVSFLDVEMKEISGIDVAKHIREEQEKRGREKSIIIFVTGYREYMEDVRKEYQLQVRENVFLILPSIAAICISITLKMMIITVENGSTILIYDTVPETQFWIPVICVLLLGAVIANVILFQNVVQYHEENRKRTMLENQIQQMQKEVQEIQDIYADMRGLRHDLRGHINNITQYVKKQNNADAEELKNYIRNMEETVSRLDFGYQTGNPITDIIIHQKKQEADKAGVKFSVDFSYPKELQIDVYDIGVILNNALENAIEAATLLNRDKYVSLHSYVKGNLFFVEVENSFAREIVMNKESGLPESSKANKKFHGMGLTNIQRCARKYRGDIDIVIDTSKQEQQIFNLTIMLNGKPVGS